MYRSAFRFSTADSDSQEAWERSLYDHAVPLLPAGLKWYFRRKGLDSTALIVEWPDKATALAWLERADVREARRRVYPPAAAPRARDHGILA